jgi:hypothetical protein
MLLRHLLKRSLPILQIQNFNLRHTALSVLFNFLKANIRHEIKALPDHA